MIPPATSSRACVPRSRVTRCSAASPTNAPTGTFTKKFQRQLSAEVRTPPTSTPAAAPALPSAPQTPSAVVRCAPVYVVVTMASADGSSIAAPTPCSARAAISAAGDHASPLISEAVVKTPSPARKTVRRPSRSASRPPKSIRPPVSRTYALTTHGSPTPVKPRSAPIDGNATFTTVMSRMTMNCATASSASTIQLVRASSVAAAWAVCG